MRSDIFSDRKSIHIKLDKELHAALRTRLFKHGLSMQEIFDECAKEIVDSTKIGNNIIMNIVTRKLTESLDGRKPRKKPQEILKEYDSESIYCLIKAGKEK